MFRVSTIFGVALCDTFLNGMKVSVIQKVALLMIFGGAFLFSKHNWAFDLLGYFYGFLYMISFVISQIILKNVFQSHVNLGVWHKTFYTNFFGAISVFVLAVFVEGFPVIPLLELSERGKYAIIISFGLGGALSYVAGSVRDLLSATSFDVLGCAGKFFTIFLSSYIFDLKYNTGMITGIIVSVVGSLIYSDSISSPLLYKASILKWNKKKGTALIRIMFALLIIPFLLICVDIFPTNGPKSDVFRSNFEKDIEVWLHKQQYFDKYIIIEPQGGFGNIFHAVSSALLLAMLANRALVVDWVGCTFDQFGPPLSQLCLKQRTMRDSKFLKLYQKNKEMSKYEQLERVVCLKARCYAAKEYKNSAKKMKFGHFPGLVQDDFNTKWQFPLVRIKAENYFIGFLFLNKAYAKHLARYQSEEFLYPKILDILFRPVPRIQNAIDVFAKEKLNGGKCISVFARTTGFHGPVTEYVHLFRSKADASLLLGPQHLECARTYFSRELSENTTIFVASLYKEVKEYFKSKYGNVVFYSEDAGSEYSVLNRDLAVIDLYLLARCSSAIYSYSSTFGQVARALAKTPQKMYQTLSPTLEDGITPIIDRIEETLYQVRADCREIKSREACAAPWVRWRNRGILVGEGETFYNVARLNSMIPASFDHGNVC
jgi:hypothetical protein